MKKSKFEAGNSISHLLYGGFGFIHSFAGTLDGVDYFYIVWHEYTSFPKKFKYKQAIPETDLELLLAEWEKVSDITIDEVVSEYNLTNDGHSILSSIEEKHPIELTSSQTNSFLDLIEYMNHSKRNENKIRSVRPEEVIIKYNYKGECKLFIF
jgi:hypothetical protein